LEDPAAEVFLGSGDSSQRADTLSGSKDDSDKDDVEEAGEQSETIREEGACSPSSSSSRSPLRGGGAKEALPGLEVGEAAYPPGGPSGDPAVVFGVCGRRLKRPAIAEPETPPAKRRRSTPGRGAAGDELGAASTSPACPSALQRMVAGDPGLQVSAWQALTVYAPPGAELTADGAQTVAWFWAYVDSLDREARADLLQWVTGYRRLPLRGFPPPHARMTVHLLAGEGGGRLPCAHTCALQLDLPAKYGCELALRSRVSEATNHCNFYMS